MRCSNWSLQKNGIGAYGCIASPLARASRFDAACAPCSAAFVQCSTRISWPSSGFVQRATSPAANTVASPTSGGSTACRNSSHTIPSRSSSPLPSSQPTDGVTPTPTTMTSAASTSDSAARVDRSDQHPAIGEPVDRDATAQIDPLRGVHGTDHRAHLGAETSDQGCRPALEHDHLVPELAGGGRDFEADEAGADDHDPPVARSDRRTHTHRVVERAQHVHVSMRRRDRRSASVRHPSR